MTSIMDNFLNIRTLFNTLNERSIDKLSAVYEHENILLEAIGNVISSNLSESDIRGRRILLKPNWVKHSTGINDDICLRTNDNFLLATLELIMRCSPSDITVGDAPIQGGRWNDIVNDNLTQKINELSEKHAVPVHIKDFRRTFFYTGKNKLKTDLRPQSDYLIFDVQEKSFLEQITDKEANKFRVTDYDPAKLNDTHKSGTHKYCITKELIENDIIISMPKIKTHQKAGLTGALKNIVGLNGDKDFLPHHTIGGTRFGGDCYPGGNHLRYWAEIAMDKANSHRGRKEYFLWVKLASLLWRLSLPKDVHNMEAGWYGNDTTWRMVMDLNRIAYYGNSDGTFSDKPNRKIFSLCDGIIGGQGDGPLWPTPLELGVISFTDNPAINDIAMASLMGFDFNKFPLLNESVILFPVNKTEIFINGVLSSLADLRKLSIKTNPPRGWKSYLQEQ
jgi:hypothetical protein